ncbi:MAG: hypothetical protein NTY10_05000 [Candidatus Omnitrophica bacterium]|nr:hypothetical protein [Candidatus Omnitrophota bacterium]
MVIGIFNTLIVIITTYQVTGVNYVTLRAGCREIIAVVFFDSRQARRKDGKK